MFLNEIVNKTVKEEAAAEELFEFLYHSLLVLDNATLDSENFHLIFLIKLSRLLGFGASHAHEISGSRILGDEDENTLKLLLAADYGSPVTMTNFQRRTLLELILKFYSEHLDTFGELKSISILKDILS